MKRTLMGARGGICIEGSGAEMYELVALNP